MAKYNKWDHTRTYSTTTSDYIIRFPLSAFVSSSGGDIEWMCYSNPLGMKFCFFLDEYLIFEKRTHGNLAYQTIKWSDLELSYGFDLTNICIVICKELSAI